MGALISLHYHRTLHRLLSCADEIGAAAILMLDVDGRVEAASHCNRLGKIQRNLGLCVEAARARETEFTTHQMEARRYYLDQSRREVGKNLTLGVIAVEVDLRKFQSVCAGIYGAVIVSLPNVPSALATEKIGIRLPEEEPLALRSAPSTFERATRAPQECTALPADAYVLVRALMRRVLRVLLRRWTIVSVTTYGGNRGRANALLAREIMAFPIQGTFVFNQLSRQSLTRALFF